MNDALDALSALDPGAMARELWIRIAFAAKDAGITEDEWLHWCERGANFDRADAIATFRNAKPKAGGVTAATLFMHAHDAGFKPAEGVKRGGNGSAGVTSVASKVAPIATDPRPAWDACQPCVGHAYLTKKRIAPHGARISSTGALVVPYWNRNRELQTIQTIAPDGTKRFLAGARAKGAVAIIGEPKDAPVIVIGEGFGTVVAIHEATGYPTLAAGSRVSFPEAAKIARHFSAGARVIIAADRGDLSTLIAAARGVGGFLAVPGPEDAPDGYDFADWRLSGESDASLRARIDFAPPPAEEAPPEPKTPAARIVSTIAPEGSPYLRDGNGTLVANFLNVATLLKTGACGELRRDTFTGVVTWRGLPMGEFTYLEILAQVQGASINGRAPFLRAGVNIVIDAIQNVAQGNSYNSNVEWLDSLPAWDGVERVARFFPDALGSDATDYLLDVSRYFWRGLVGRMVNPGMQVDSAVALVGSQGIGKSSLARLVGGERYGEVGLAHIGERDWCAQLRGKIIVEIGELSGHSRAELESIKAVLTRTHDEYRAPYARVAAMIPRGCIFLATTNEQDFLIDASGNRRWLPVACGDALLLDFVRSTREQLFAEAYTQIRTGLSPDWYIVADAPAVQAAHVARDPWIDELDEKLRDLNGVYPERISNTALYVALKIPTEHQTGATGRRIASVMRALGFVRSTWYAQPGNRRVRGYIVAEAQQ